MDVSLGNELKGDAFTLGSKYERNVSPEEHDDCVSLLNGARYDAQASISGDRIRQSCNVRLIMVMDRNDCGCLFQVAFQCRLLLLLLGLFLMMFSFPAAPLRGTRSCPSSNVALLKFVLKQRQWMSYCITCNAVWIFVVWVF